MYALRVLTFLGFSAMLLFSKNRCRTTSNATSSHRSVTSDGVVWTCDSSFPTLLTFSIDARFGRQPPSIDSRYFKNSCIAGILSIFFLRTDGGISFGGSLAEFSSSSISTSSDEDSPSERTGINAAALVDGSLGWDIGGLLCLGGGCDNFFFCRILSRLIAISLLYLKNIEDVLVWNMFAQ